MISYQVSTSKVMAEDEVTTYTARMAQPEVRFLLRLPPELYEALRAQAEKDQRSMNREAIYLLQWALEEIEKRPRSYES